MLLWNMAQCIAPCSPAKIPIIMYVYQLYAACPSGHVPLLLCLGAYDSRSKMQGLWFSSVPVMIFLSSEEEGEVFKLRLWCATLLQNVKWLLSYSPISDMPNCSVRGCVTGGLRWQPLILFRFPLSPQSADWGRSCAGAITTNFYQINIAAQIFSKFGVEVHHWVGPVVARNSGRAKDLSILSTTGLNCGQ